MGCQGNRRYLWERESDEATINQNEECFLLQEGKAFCEWRLDQALVHEDPFRKDELLEK